MPELGVGLDEAPQELDAPGVVEQDDAAAVPGHPRVAALEYARLPITTVPMANWRSSPLQYQQGESVVAMTQSA